MLDRTFEHGFIACRLCAVAYQLHPVDGDEGFASDCQTFVLAHAGHPLETLSRYGSSAFSDRPFWDPMATRYQEVTNGLERLVLCSVRDSIQEPLRHILIPGRLRCRCVGVEIDGDLLRLGLDQWFYPQALPPVKIDAVVAAFDDLVCRLEPSSLPIICDDADDPRVTIARVPDVVQPDVISRCAGRLDAWELERMRAFLQENGGDDGLLALRVTRTFEIEPL